MKTTLYRRHWADCVAGHKKPSKEAQEQDKRWQPCTCAIYAYGQFPTGAKAAKCSTGARDWESAKAVVLDWQTNGRRDAGPMSRMGNPALAPASGDPKVDQILTSFLTSPASGPALLLQGHTIEAAADIYLTEHTKLGSAKHTVKIKRLMLGKLKQFSFDVKGYTHLCQWRREDVEQFLGWWECSLGTTGRNWSQVKAFFEFFVGKKDGIPYNVARFKTITNRAIQGAAGDAQKSPFTNEELERMVYNARMHYGKKPIRWSRKVHHEPAAASETVNYRYSWTGEDLVDFILLSVYVGLRISDIATFNINQIAKDGSVHFRALKNGTFVDTWLPQWVEDKMRARVPKYGKYIFGYKPRPDEDMDVVTDLPRRKLKRLWELCGDWKEEPTHHRFRHTFVRILLQDHVPVERVALLLGDTPEVVRRHYSKWIPKHQEEIKQDLQKAFASVPKWV